MLKAHFAANAVIKFFDPFMQLHSGVMPNFRYFMEITVKLGILSYNWLKTHCLSRLI